MKGYVFVPMLLLCALFVLSCGSERGEDDLVELLLTAADLYRQLGEVEKAGALLDYLGREEPDFTRTEEPGRKLLLSSLLFSAARDEEARAMVLPLLASGETEVEALLLLHRMDPGEQRYEWGVRLLHHRTNPLTDQELFLLGGEAIDRGDAATAREAAEQLKQRRVPLPFLLLSSGLDEALGNRIQGLCARAELHFYLSTGSGIGTAGGFSPGFDTGAEADVETWTARLLQAFFSGTYGEVGRLFPLVRNALISRDETPPDFLILAAILSRMEEERAELSERGDLLSGERTGSGRSPTPDPLAALMRDYLSLEERFFYSQGYYLAGARLARFLPGEEALFETCCERVILLDAGSPAALEARQLLARRYGTEGCFLLPEESLALAGKAREEGAPFLLSLIVPMLDAAPGRFRLAAEAALLQGLRTPAGKSYLLSLVGENGAGPGPAVSSRGINRLEELLGAE